MARGKHAAQAARQRHEAALQVNDRLSDKLAEAKVRARLVESQADRVPGLERRIAELQEQIRCGVGQEWAAERRRLEERALLAEMTRGELLDLFNEFIGVVGDLPGMDEVAWIPESLIDSVTKNGNPYGLVIKALGGNRENRRVQLYRKSGVSQRTATSVQRAFAHGLMA